MQESTTSSRPIGVLDSGVGGLSVLSSLQALLPAEHYLYVADSAYAPYGPLSEEAIKQRCHHILSFFSQRDVKAVVLACNTATAAAVAWLREVSSLPIIGMEPALKPAAEVTRSGVVGVLATEGTIESDKFLSLKNRFSDQIEAITVACHGWVESIEQGESAQQREPLLREALAPLFQKGVDTLILGCTHYPLIRQEIEAVSAALGNPGVRLLETGNAVARELKRRLAEKNLLAESVEKGQIEFFTSGDTSVQSRLVSGLWHTPVVVSLLPSQEELVEL